MASETLTDADKARIRNEELFRSEVRKELNPPPVAKTRRERLWEFANSAFGLALLFTVVLGGSAKWYTDHQNKIEEAAKKREAEVLEERRIKELYDRLMLEISFRYSVTMSKLKDADTKYAERDTSDSQNAVARALAPLALPTSETFPPLFQEFKSYSGLALIAELRRHGGAGEKKELDRILVRTTGLIYETTGENKRTNRSPRSVASLLIHTMHYAKWDKGFPYTDCTEEKPFC
jgi:hypothetical protein